MCLMYSETILDLQVCFGVIQKRSKQFWILLQKSSYNHRKRQYINRIYTTSAKYLKAKGDAATARYVIKLIICILVQHYYHNKAIKSTSKRTSLYNTKADATWILNKPPENCMALRIQWIPIHFHWIHSINRLLHLRFCHKTNASNSFMNGGFLKNVSYKLYCLFTITSAV